MTRLRVGCVGTGLIAGRHLAALATFPDVEVVAVADPVPERVAGAAARYGARTYAAAATSAAPSSPTSSRSPRRRRCSSA